MVVDLRVVSSWRLFYEEKKRFMVRVRTMYRQFSCICCNGSCKCKQAVFALVMDEKKLEPTIPLINLELKPDLPSITFHEVHLVAHLMVHNNKVINSI